MRTRSGNNHVASRPQVDNGGWPPGQGLCGKPMTVHETISTARGILYIKQGRALLGLEARTNARRWPCWVHSIRVDVQLFLRQRTVDGLCARPWRHPHLQPPPTWNRNRISQLSLPRRLLHPPLQCAKRSFATEPALQLLPYCPPNLPT
jgi:hypothetical protein